MRIQDTIHESIGPIVIFPRNEREDDIGELLRERTDLLDKNLQRRHTHAILSVQLLYDQLRIQVTHETIGVVLSGKFEPFDEGAVLGDVVRCNADDLSMLFEDGPAERILNNTGNGGLPRIPARPPVGKEVEDATAGDGLSPLFYWRRCQCLFHRLGCKTLALANEGKLLRDLALQ